MGSSIDDTVLALASARLAATLGAALQPYFLATLLAFLAALMLYDLVRFFLAFAGDVFEKSRLNLRLKIRFYRKLLERNDLNRERRLNVLVEIERLEEELAEKDNRGIVL